MVTIAERVETLARALDDSGRTDSEIRVKATRETLRRTFKPIKRGGDLMCGGHIVTPVATVDPAPEQVDIEDLCNADDH